MIQSRGLIRVTDELGQLNWQLGIGEDNTQPSSTVLSDLISRHGILSSNVAVSYVGTSLRIQTTYANAGLPASIGEVGLYLDGILFARHTFTPKLSRGTGHLLVLWNITVSRG